MAEADVIQVGRCVAVFMDGRELTMVLLSPRGKYGLVCKRTNRWFDYETQAQLGDEYQELLSLRYAAFQQLPEYGSLGI